MISYPYQTKDRGESFRWRVNTLTRPHRLLVVDVVVRVAIVLVLFFHDTRWWRLGRVAGRDAGYDGLHFVRTLFFGPQTKFGSLNKALRVLYKTAVCHSSPILTTGLFTITNYFNHTSWFTILCSPNEDFGSLNKALRVRF